jgi:hypothetical protein
MPSSRHAIPASAADNVALAGNQFTWMEIVDVRSGLYNLPDEFVPDRHRNPDGLLGPLVPIENVDICPANSRPENTDQNVIDTDSRLRDVLKPQPLLRASFDECFHWVFPVFGAGAGLGAGAGDDGVVVDVVLDAGV